MKDVTVEQLLAKAEQPSKDAMRLHPFYKGKIEVIPKCRIRDFNDFAIWYTPGVSAPCQAIKNDREKVYDFTNRWNTIAVVSDGSRVLGLGDIGPEAGLPVMEGKALLFKYLGGVDAFPICLKTTKPDEIVRVCELLEPSFGGINLEDIEKPKCFHVLEKARERLHIPVWHDDQQGTAVVTLAGLINALKVVGKSKEEVSITIIGVGAANVAIVRMLIVDGFRPDRFVLVDSKGILHRGRKDLEMDRIQNPYKWELCEITNLQGKTGVWLRHLQMLMSALLFLVQVLVLYDLSG